VYLARRGFEVTAVDSSPTAVERARTRAEQTGALLRIVLGDVFEFGETCGPFDLVFDAAGNLVGSWGGPGQGYDWPKSEHSVYIDDNDFIWLAGNDKADGQILKFTMDGKLVLQIGKPIDKADSNSTERLGSPADIAVDVAAKEVYVADGYSNRRVVVFDSETGAYKRHWGAYGNRPSDDKTPPYDPAKPVSQQFGNPVHCVRISKDGLVYVCDRTNDRYQIFRKDGTFVSEHFFERNTRLNGSVY
jgi:DNA-binding beta-propeller fold protein YncE